MLKVEQLEHGKSFNNRIYFLNHSNNQVHGHGGNDGLSQVEVFRADHVLKVARRFWGLDKVQIEVSSLVLLERYCPTVPSPKVIAYSEDGVEVLVPLRRRDDGRLEGFQKQVNEASLDHSQHRPWILLTRCPWRPVEES